MDLSYLDSGRYEEFLKRLKMLLEQLLKEENIKFQNIIGRIKDKKSAEKKFYKKGIRINEMQDLVALRVITYLKSDAKKIANLIEQEFNVDKKLTKDHSKSLKVDQVGYRGKNYVVKLSDSRKSALEWRNYSDIKFEIQVHTILEYAWSEIQHDRNYKFSGKLPLDVSRKFHLLAGSLDLLDLNFDELCEKVDNYESYVIDNINFGKLENIDLNTISLGVLLSNKFKDKKLVSEFEEEDYLKIANLLGITDFKKMGEIIDSFPFEEYIKVQIGISFSDLMRDILIITFGDKFFEMGEKNKLEKYYSNVLFGEEESKFFLEKGVDLKKIMKEKKLNWSIREEDKSFYKNYL